MVIKVYSEHFGPDEIILLGEIQKKPNEITTTGTCDAHRLGSAVDDAVEKAEEIHAVAIGRLRKAEERMRRASIAVSNAKNVFKDAVAELERLGRL